MTGGTAAAEAIPGCAFGRSERVSADRQSQVILPWN